MNRSIQARSSVRADRRRLSDVARHVVLSKDITTTGWLKVEAQARLCGIEYDGWQCQLVRCILGKTSDGVYVAGIGGVVISICRQVDKTFLIGTMIVMLCILSDYLLKVLWTAHRTRTSNETFKVHVRSGMAQGDQTTGNRVHQRIPHHVRRAQERLRSWPRQRGHRGVQ